MTKLSTKEIFVSKANLLHTNKFRYDNFIYIKSNIPGWITCPDHNGDFLLTPNKHLMGRGCNVCNKWPTSIPSDEFINQIIALHGDKYDLSKAHINIQISKGRTGVEITCKEHNFSFIIRKDHLLLGNEGCRLCHKRNISFSFEEVKRRGNEIHNNKFEYLLIFKEYKWGRDVSVVKVKCPFHGIIDIDLGSHLAGYDCRFCFYADEQYTFEEAIQKANSIHNFKYTYDQLFYDDRKIRWFIYYCPDHGQIKQRMISHFRGAGCCHCSHYISIAENQWLDILNIPKTYRQFKIMIGNKRFVVDGYSPDTNTIYEFNGDFWHGNPNIYNLNDMNNVVGKTFRELYQKTINKENILKLAGYNVVSIWEQDFIQQIKEIDNE